MERTPEYIKNALDFGCELQRHGFDFFTGVPCSYLGALIDRLSGDGKGRYIPAVREDQALGLAGGAFLGGRTPAVLMQNSGLGYSLNVLTSLNLIYRMPLLLIVSWRGLGPDAPEHRVMGAACRKLLDIVGVESRLPAGAGELAESLGAAVEAMRRTRTPYALFIKAGIFGS